MSRALGEVIEINSDKITVGELLRMLQARMPPSDEPPLSRANILVGVNGVEVSALNGEETRVSRGDIVTLIPISHGG